MVLGCCMTAFPEETADGIAEAPPNRSLIGEGPRAALRQRVHAPSPSRLGGRPVTAEQARLFEPMQCGVDRSLGQLECTTATAVYLLNDGVTVRRSTRQRREHDHVEMTFEHFAFHRPRLSLAILGVNAP